MATLTELKKQGIANLIQDWPIESLIDYDMVRPIEDYSGSIPYDESVLGFVLNPEPKYLEDPPEGPPLGLSRAYGTDPFIYVRDVEKFQPEWTPGATEEGRLNKEIAENIGHERRHHLFINNPELLEDFNTAAFGYNTNVAHESYNQWLDMVAGGKKLGTSDIYNDRRLRNYVFNKRQPGHGTLGITGLENLFRTATEKYRKHVAPKAGPQARAPRPTPTYVSPARPHGDDRGSIPTGTAGRNPWGRADGGLATMFQRR